jgi:hypothetical protein
MTSGRTGRSGDFADALFGADGTGDPVVAGSAPTVFADPMADAPVVPRADRLAPPVLAAPPDPSSRVPAPSPQAIARAEQQLAAERRRAAAARETPRQREAELQRLRETARRRAAAGKPAPPAHAPAPFASPGPPVNSSTVVSRRGAAPGTVGWSDRSAVLKQLTSADPEQRRQLMRQLAAARGKPTRKPGKGSWFFLLFFLLLILLGTGAGKEIVQAIVDALNSGR